MNTAFPNRHDKGRSYYNGSKGASVPKTNKVFAKATEYDFDLNIEKLSASISSKRISLPDSVTTEEEFEKWLKESIE